MKRPTEKLQCLATLLLLLVFSSPSTAQEGYVSLWLKDSSLIEASELSRVVTSHRPPNQIVVLVHGYDMGARESEQKFRELAKLLEQNLSPEMPLIVGLQWESGGRSFLNPLGDYFRTLERARSIGRGPARQLFLALQDTHPDVPISVFAHSMGCEVTLAAVAPEIEYREENPKGDTFAPGATIRLALAAFAGSDLDYDIWQQSGAAVMPWFENVGLTWLTVSDPISQGDRVLSFRTRLRGKAAGSLMPLMSQEQLDTVLPASKFLLDEEEVPADHELDSYFSSRRVERISQAMLYLTALGPEPPELQALRQLLEAPDTLPSLRRFLDSPHAGVAFVALWRLERLLCGDSRHMADQTLENAVRLLADRPKAIWPLQATSECETLRRALFPTESTMQRAGAPYRSRPDRYRPPGRLR